MDVETFTEWWRQRDRHELERIARALAAEVSSADGAVAWWRATTEVAAELRRTGRGRLACGVAHHVSEIAMQRCTDTGLSADDRDAATRVVRAAGDAARAIVAGRTRGTAAEHLFGPLLGLPA